MLLTTRHKFTCPWQSNNHKLRSRSSLLQCTHTFLWVPNPLLHVFPANWRCPSHVGQDPFYFTQARFASGSENWPLPYLHVARGTGIQGCFLVYITNLDRFPFATHSHYTHHLALAGTESGEGKTQTKWRQMLSFSSLSSPCSSFCSAQPPPATTTATPSAKAFSSSKASAPANSPPTSASAGATTLHCTTAPPPE